MKSFKTSLLFLTILSLFAAVLVLPNNAILSASEGSQIGDSSVSPQNDNSVMFYYVAKLKSANIDQLSKIAVNIEKQFEFSGDKSFKNIYTFQSQLPIATVKSQLSGVFEYLDYDPTVQVKATSTRKLPDDPGFTTNQGNIDKQWGLAKAEFPDGWRLTTGTTDITVAVIDTGIDSTHEDLIDSYFVGGYNVVASKKISAYSNSDDNGHGTLVAGVIGATTNNDIGIAGAAHQVSLMAIKALNTRGSGTASQISEGIVWASDNGADVINMSLGGLGFSHNTTLANAITYAFEKNVVLVSAAGNDVAITGGNLDYEPVFPICNDNGQNMIIGVSATDVNDLKPNFANYGKACVDVVAPGRRILSTINHDPATGLFSPDSYAYASGTSLAVPFVSAQAALLKSLYPNASNKQIRDRIIATADSVDKLNTKQCAGRSCKGLLGSGRINVGESLKEEIPTLHDGDLVEVEETGELFYINGGKRQPVSNFVLKQRFADVKPRVVLEEEVQLFSEGSYAEPLDGTLIQTSSDQTVYYMSKGVRLPITYQVFMMRGFSFQSINRVPPEEINSWILGSFLTPPDGTLIRSTNNPTIYWVVNGILHPVNFKFYTDRGLSVFPVVYISDKEISGFPAGESYAL